VEHKPVTLPERSHLAPAPAVLQTLGWSWLANGRTAMMGVPSAVLMVERYILLNPWHPYIQRVRIISDEPFSLDARLLG
jgi:RES domain-containing protein